jgi:2-dehydropantoate 2-reductase
MRFAVLGTGGVGGYFGGKLAKAGSDVWFIARGAHLEAMKKSGLQIHSTEGSWVVPAGKMTDRPAEIGGIDVVFFCVKSYDTESAARKLAPLVDDSTFIISLQNGIDNEEKIEAVLERGIVCGGVANIYSTITAPGVITESGGPRKLIFGPLQPWDEPALVRKDQLLKELLNAHISAEYTEEIRLALWKKFIFITAVGGLTALTRLTLGEILAANETRSLLRDAMDETEAVAHKSGIDVEKGFIDSVFDILKNFKNDTRSSLYHDLSHGKPLEIEALCGTVARLGRQLGVPTPIQSTIYASLLPYHQKHTTRRGET